jgi:hypothetical protein
MASSPRGIRGIDVMAGAITGAQINHDERHALAASISKSATSGGNTPTNNYIFYLVGDQ